MVAKAGVNEEDESGGGGKATGPKIVNGAVQAPVRTATAAKATTAPSTTIVAPGSPPPVAGGAQAALGKVTAGAATAEQKALDNMDSDLAAGQKYTSDSGAFANGAMGRVSDTTSAAQADALAKQQALEGGLTGPAMQAREEQNDAEIGSQEQANMMALQGIQGAQGLRGASAGAQQTGLLYNALAQHQAANRQLTLDDLAAKQSGISNFLSANAANDATNRAGTQYNNQQANAEAAGRLSTPLTYAGLLQGVRTGADANAIAQSGAQTAAKAADNANTNAKAALLQNQGANDKGATDDDDVGY